MADRGHAACTPDARAHAVEHLAALSCATTAEMLEVIVVMDRAEDHRIDGALDMAAWLVATLHVSASTAREWVRVARALDDLPRLREAFASGVLSWDQIAAATRFASAETDGLLAEELPGCTAGQIAEMARQRRARTRSDAQRSHQERHLRWRKDQARIAPGAVVHARPARVTLIIVRGSSQPSARAVRCGQGGPMRVTGIHANLPVADIAAARDFYIDYLGLSVEEFNMGWVARYSSPSGEASVQLVTHDATAPHDSVISVHVGAGVDEAYAEAERRGYEIVHPLTEEAWGLRRFFVRAPDGNVINVVSHSDD